MRPSLHLDLRLDGKMRLMRDTLTKRKQPRPARAGVQTELPVVRRYDNTRGTTSITVYYVVGSTRAAVVGESVMGH